MHLLRFLINRSKRMTMAVAIAGLIGGLCSAALIGLINSAIHQDDAVTGYLVLSLIAVGFGKVAAVSISKWLLARFGLAAMLDLTVDLSRKLMTVPLQLLEQTGHHRIMTALTNDTAVLVQAIQTIPNIAVNGSIVVGCGAYLAWLYPIGFVALCVVVILGVAVYKFLHTTAFKAIFRQREERDNLMKHYRSLVGGIKELKMNHNRGDEFLSSRIDQTAKKVQSLNLIARTRYIVLDAWNQVLFYLMIAGILYFFPREDSASVEVLTGYIFAALFVMTPIWSIISSIPVFLSGQVSLGKLEELGILLASEEGERTSTDEILLSHITLDLRGVQFQYKSSDVNDRYPFRLGPIDLSVPQGEVLFIVGGNGSGKSTLVNLLAGLYAPIEGEVVIGGQAITERNRDWYREHISVVFSDFYLFDGLLGSLGPDVDDRANEYLKKLELDHKVSVLDRKFSTIDLSQGQKKRLGLLTAIIENRPINIFDEWAADQDPHYKEIFYSKLLPELKAQGKTVIVITHDDRYFSQGDRVIRLQDGVIATQN